MTEPAAHFRRVQVARAFEDIAGQIRAELSEGRLRAGDRLPPERELADRFGVSRNTLREALRSLEISGIIALKKGATGGAFVKDSNGEVVVNSLRDFYRLGAVTPEQVTEARIWIESAIVREAVARHTADDIAALHANLAVAQDAISRKDFPARAETHLEFHRVLARITRNPIIEIIMDGLIGVMRHFIRTIGPRWDNDYVLPSRRRFMRHLEARDADAAVAEMERHLRRVRRNYLALLGGPQRQQQQQQKGIDARLHQQKGVHARLQRQQKGVHARLQQKKRVDARLQKSMPT